MEDTNCNKELTADYMDKTGKYDSDEETNEKHNQWNHCREKEKRYKSSTKPGKCSKMNRKKLLVIMAAFSVLILFCVAIGLINDYVTEIACGNPPNVVNTSYLKTGTKQGATAVYRCLPGYASHGDTKLYCHDNGQWSNVSFSCMKDCSSPPYVSHSTGYKTRNKSRIVSFYYCDHGYYLVGKPTIWCQNDGQWSNISFSCLKYCSSPPHIPQSANNMTGNMSGAIASYHCLPGYFLVGEPNIVCNDNGDWSTTNLLCVKDCGIPPDVSHSTHHKSGNTTGVFVSYKCLHGYYTVGKPALVCQNDGLWSKVNFSCLKYCGSPAQIFKSTNHMSGNMSGAIATYRCLPGYDLIGEPNTICKDNGEWSAVKFSCLKDCGIPPAKRFAKADFTNTYSGSSATYYCMSGFTGFGNTQTHCQSNGKWTQINFHCARKQQPRPVSYETNGRSDGIIYSGSWTYVLLIGVLIQLFL